MDQREERMKDRSYKYLDGHGELKKPRPIDTSDEIVGKVICNIRVDSDGYISAQLIVTTPSSVAIAYKNSLDGLQLEVKDEGVTLGSM